MNAPASLSTEGKIISNLAALRMNRKEFVEICRAMNVKMSESLMSFCLNGQREFSQWTGIQLSKLMAELVELKNHYGVALNWSSSEDIATLIVQRRMHVANEDVEASIRTACTSLA